MEQSSSLKPTGTPGATPTTPGPGGTQNNGLPARLQIAKAGTQSQLVMLAYGSYGVGKTVLLGSAALDSRTSPMLLIDFEGGSASLSGLDVDVVRVTTVADIIDIHAGLAKKQIRNSAGQLYNSVGLDSLTVLHNAVLQDTMRESASGKKLDMTDQPEQRDYLRALMRMRRIIAGFRDLPMHVFFTALLKEEVETGVGLIRKPALPGQFADEIGGIVSVIGYMTAVEKEGNPAQRIFYTSPNKGVRAKFRTPYGVKAPPAIMEPTMSKILDIYEGRNSK